MSVLIQVHAEKHLQSASLAHLSFPPAHLLLNLPALSPESSKRKGERRGGEEERRGGEGIRNLPPASCQMIHTESLSLTAIPACTRTEEDTRERERDQTDSPVSLPEAGIRSQVQ
ncbi:unnamed protein product [Leuciscus chuanchicus]